MRFKKGDIVKINKDCTIGELNANHSNGCRESTFDFIEHDQYHSTHTYKIDKVCDKYVYEIGEYMVNAVCLKLVQTKIREMTIAQISKELGYDVKIIKED